MLVASCLAQVLEAAVAVWVVEGSDGADCADCESGCFDAVDSDAEIE